MMEDIGDDELPTVLLILETKFQPLESIIDLQSLGRNAENNYGTNSYNALVSEIIADIYSYIDNYSKLLNNGLLDSSKSTVEKNITGELIKVLEHILNRTKNNDLSWAWEDIKL